MEAAAREVGEAAAREDGEAAVRGGGEVRAREAAVGCWLSVLRIRSNGQGRLVISIVDFFAEHRIWDARQRSKTQFFQYQLLYRELKGRSAKYLCRAVSKDARRRSSSPRAI